MLIDQAEALNGAGANKQALARARTATAEADRLGLPGLGAEARIQLAGALYESGTLDGVIEACEQAARLAAEAHEDRRVASAWINALHFVGGRKGKLAEATRLEPVAEAAVIRAGNSVDLRASLAVDRAELANMRGDWTTARDRLVEAIALTKQARGAESPALARLSSLLGTAYTQLHDEASARAAFEDARVRLIRLYGDTTPHLGVVLTNLGVLERATGHLKEARGDLEAALAIKQRAVGPNHVSLAPTLADLGLVLEDLGDLRGAHDVAARSLALVEKAYGPTAIQLVSPLQLLANLAHETGDDAAGLPLAERAVALQAEVAEAPPLDVVLGTLVVIQIELHQVTRARANIDRAMAITQKSHDPDALAEVLVAEAFVQVAEHRPTARAALEHALARVKASQSGGRQRTKLEQALAALH
jgi:tetratricopeptide (TPR) repeat protein